MWVNGGQYINCTATNLTIDHAYIKGSLQWRGCGKLTISNSVVDWEPGSSPWFSVYAYCPSTSTNGSIVATGSTFETANDAAYTGRSDIGAIDINSASNMPMYVSNSLFRDFPQGLDPQDGSIIRDNEIYTANLTCWLSARQGTTAPCHDDGLFSQGGNNITYEGNYIVVTHDATSAIFYQSNPHSASNRVIDNFLEGGSFSLYNEDSDGLVVENNTFGSDTYGYAALCSGSWGTWSGNVRVTGKRLAAPASTCSY